MCRTSRVLFYVTATGYAFPSDHRSPGHLQTGPPILATTISPSSLPGSSSPTNTEGPPSPQNQSIDSYSRATTGVRLGDTSGDRHSVYAGQTFNYGPIVRE